MLQRERYVVVRNVGIRGDVLCVWRWAVRRHGGRKERDKEKEEARTSGCTITFFGVGETLAEKGVFFTLPGSKKGISCTILYTFNLILT